MRLRVPVIAANVPDWVRKAAQALNSALNDIEGAQSNITTLQGVTTLYAPVTIAADYSVGTTDRDIINNKSGSTCTLTLPNPATNTGRRLTIKTVQAQTVVSASSNVVPLAGGSAASAILAATAGKWATLVSDATNWIIMEGN